MLGKEAASNPGGEDSPARNYMDPTSEVLRDKEGDMARPKGRRRRKVSYLTINKIDTIDYKEVALLRRFINDRGKMYGTRQTGNTAKQQRMVANAIRRAREMALIPFVMTEIVSDRPVRGRGDRRDRGGDRGADRNSEPRQDRAVEQGRVVRDARSPSGGPAPCPRGSCAGPRSAGLPGGNPRGSCRS